tara:strand:- start:830 stop:1453 length:624 start_codon:yes stop_codon:yes gene_type:complete
MSKRTKANRSWQQRQEKDIYVQRARRDGWRSRAVFKLEQILAKEQLLKTDMVCIDLGAAPGSWSQYITVRLNGRVKIIAVDLLPMDKLPFVHFVLGDFTDDDIIQQIEKLLCGGRADLVISDMAPNITGTKAVDQPRSMYLAEQALEFSVSNLKIGGDFICKVFQGQGIDEFVSSARQTFGRVKLLKPKASRSKSSEIYLVARNRQL